MRRSRTFCAVLCAGLLVAGLGDEARGADDPVIKGRRLSRWLTQLRSRNIGLQMRASRALKAAPEELRPKIVPKLAAILGSDRDNDRFVAAQVLGEYGPAARETVPLLVPLLKGTQFERNRAAAAKALGQILKDARPSPEVESVARALSAKYNEDYDNYADVRRESVRAVGMIGPAAKAVIPRLTRGLTDFKKWSEKHQQVRQQAAWTCGRMGPLAKEHIDRLIAMMHKEGHDLREIVEAIGLIGPVHENVIPNIMDKIESAGKWLTSHAAFKVAAFEALARFGEKSAPAAPLIRRFLRELKNRGRSDLLLKTAALKTLAAIGPAAKEAIPEIESQLRLKTSRVPGVSSEESESLFKDVREAAAKAYESVTGKKPPKTK